MTAPRRVLYFAENALSAIQGGGIVAYAVLKGLPADHLLGFFEYRNITPVPEYAERFVHLGQAWRAPRALARLNRWTRGLSANLLRRVWPDAHVAEDLAFVQAQVTSRAFAPEVVYFAGLSYRYLRLAVMAAEHYGVPMVQLNMDDWMQVETEAAGRFGGRWSRLITRELTRASAASLVSTSNSPRLAARLSAMTGHQHVAANNCCDDLMVHATDAAVEPNPVPVITYAGAMNLNLQGETLKVLASAVAELNAEGTPVHLHIYTPWEFAPLANSIAVPGAVFYKGQVGRAKLADIYRASDFLATTVTYREKHISLFRHSLSTKLSEYLCAGKPVLSMGHYDWHLHEYVQEHGCGFSVLMDEAFSRAAIKAQLRQILSTDSALLVTMGQQNRALWERAHDVTRMARETRQALRLDGGTPSRERESRRGVIWLGEATGRAWVPADKAMAIARQLRDVYHHQAVDLAGAGILAHPGMTAVRGYCADIGLLPHVLDTESVDPIDVRYEPAGARWSLAAAQRSPVTPLTTPPDVFAQVADLRDEVPRTTPAARAIQALSVRVSEFAARRPVVWTYGNTTIGNDVLTAIAAHPWLGDAVRPGGFLAEPGSVGADILHGRTLRSLDRLMPEDADFVFITDDAARLTRMEELSRHGLLGRAIPLFGSSADQPPYERDPDGPGQVFGEGLTALDYATRELAARTRPKPVGWTDDGFDERDELRRVG